MIYNVSSLLIFAQALHFLCKTPANWDGFLKKKEELFVKLKKTPGLRHACLLSQQTTPRRQMRKKFHLFAVLTCRSIKAESLGLNNAQKFVLYTNIEKSFLFIVYV